MIYFSQFLPQLTPTPIKTHKSENHNSSFVRGMHETTKFDFIHEHSLFHIHPSAFVTSIDLLIKRFVQAFGILFRVDGHLWSNISLRVLISLWAKSEKYCVCESNSYNLVISTYKTMDLVEMCTCFFLTWCRFFRNFFFQT